MSLYADVVMLAAGGIGQLYRVTSNASVATGDGIAMAYRAGAPLRDMAFVQFHPTIFDGANQERTSFLISEALRGAGAYLRNDKEERFMGRYDERKELAPRDVVSRAIYNEVQHQSKDYVGLDVRHLNPATLTNHFPNILHHCQKQGIDVTNDLIPVTPGAHYLCGGISVDEWGRTAIENLYAAGECSCTGLHGANRLASNSLLEGLVFAHRSYLDSKNKSTTRKVNVRVLKENLRRNKGYTRQYTDRIKYRLQRIMSQSVAIIRNQDDLKGALQEINRLYRDITDDQTLRHRQEMNNMCKVAQLIIDDSLKQPENRGVFYNTSIA